MFILRLWFLFLPILIYGIWYFRAYKKGIEKKDINKKLLITFCATITLVIIYLIMMAKHLESKRDTSYIYEPVRYKNELYKE